MLDILLVCVNGKVALHSLDPNNPIRSIKNVKTKIPLSEQMIAFDNQFYKDPIIMKRNYNLLVDNAFSTRISGSSVFDIAMMVVGKLNARIWHDTEIYDVAPAFAFLKHLGCVLNLETGCQAALNDRRIVCTTDTALYEQLKKIGFSGEI